MHPHFCYLGSGRAARRGLACCRKGSPMGTATRRRLRFGMLGAPASLPRADRSGDTPRRRRRSGRGTRPRAREAFAATHGIGSVSLLRELLERDDLDAVYLPLPPAFRSSGRCGRSSGLHVLAEKPIAMDAGQAREMVDAAEARGLVLAEGFHYVFHPMFARALELLGGRHRRGRALRGGVRRRRAARSRGGDLSRSGARGRRAAASSLLRPARGSFARRGRTRRRPRQRR